MTEVKMKLITETQMKKLIANHQNQDGSKSFKAVVKLFNPTGIGTWYLSELDPSSNIAFGVCDLGCPEMGSVSIDEIKSIDLPFGLKIERDKFFKENEYTLEECLAFCK